MRIKVLLVSLAILLAFTVAVNATMAARYIRTYSEYASDDSSCSGADYTMTYCSDNGYEYSCVALYYEEDPNSVYGYASGSVVDCGDAGCNPTTLECYTSALSCADECTPSGATQCYTTMSQKTCGNYDTDSCLEWSDAAICSSPPVSTCPSFTTLRTYSSAGSCSAGSCSYSSTDTTCTYGCSNGQCNSPPACTPSWSCTSWSTCSASYSSTCSNSASGTQTCTGSWTDSNNCGQTYTGSSARSCSITRNTDGTVCNTVPGTWGACSDSYADVCDTSYSGTQSRSVTKYSCSSGTCPTTGGTTSSESQACSDSRTTAGNACTKDCSASSTTCRTYNNVAGTCSSGACSGTCNSYTDASATTSCTTSTGTSGTCSGGSCVDANPSGTVSTLPTSPTAGSTFSITVSGSDDNQVKKLSAAYRDYNNNGQYGDSGDWERCYCDGSSTPACSTIAADKKSCSNSWSHSESTTGTKYYYGNVMDSASQSSAASPDPLSVTIVAATTTTTPTLTTFKIREQLNSCLSSLDTAMVFRDIENVPTEDKWVFFSPEASDEVNTLKEVFPGEEIHIILTDDCVLIYNKYTYNLVSGNNTLIWEPTPASTSTPTQPQGPVTLYKSTNYQFTASDQFQDIQYGTTVTPNFFPKSVKVPSSAVAYIFYGSHVCQTFLADNSNMDISSAIGSASSASAYSSFSGVIMYTHAQGSSLNWNQYYLENSYASLNSECIGKGGGLFSSDSISSFTLAPNYLVVVYDNADFNKNNGFKVFSTSQSSLSSAGWNDRMSSFRVCRYDSTSCVPNTEDSTKPSISAFTWDTQSNIPLQVAKGGSITFGVKATDNYWVSKCELLVSGAASSTLPMSVTSQTETGFEGSKAYQFNIEGSYSVKTRCYDLAGNSEDSLSVSVEAKPQPTPSPCGTCSSPKSLGTLSNYGDTIPVTLSDGSTCSLSSTAQNDIYKFTVNKVGYLITTMDGPGSCDWDFWVNAETFCGSESMYIAKSGTGVKCDDSATGQAIVAGDRYIKVHRNSGDGQGSISVKLGECLQNSDCTSRGTGWTCRLSDNTCVAPQPLSCTPSWSCTSWSTCSASYSSTCSNSASGTETCTGSWTDSNNCGQTYTGSSARSCSITRNTAGNACTKDCSASSTTCRTYNNVAGTCSSGACSGTCNSYTDASATTSCTTSTGTSGTCSGGSCVDANPSGTVSTLPTSPTAGSTFSITVSGSDDNQVKRLAANFAGSWNYCYCDGSSTPACSTIAADKKSCSNSWTHTETTTGTKSYAGSVMDSAGQSSAASPDPLSVTIAVATQPQVETCTTTQPSSSIPLNNGCSLTMASKGYDRSANDPDNGAGRYRSTVYGTNSIQTEFDDMLSGGCDMDLRFTNSWTIGTGSSSNKITIDSAKNAKDAGNPLAYGYTISSSDCSILSFNQCSVDAYTTCPSVGVGITSGEFTVKDTRSSFSTEFTIGKCLQNSDCATTNYACHTNSMCTVIDSPVLVSPSAGATVSLTPTISWNNNDYRTTYYKYYIRTSSQTPDTAVVTGTATHPTLNYIVPSGTLSGETTYFWSVKECTDNTYTRCSNYATERSFTTQTVCTYGTCSSPKSLGTLSNYGDTPLTGTSCALSSTKVDDTFKFTVNKEGAYVIATLTSPYGNTVSMNVVGPKSPATSQYCSGSYSCSATAFLGGTASCNFIVPVGGKGEYSVALKQYEGSGTSEVKVRLGECLQNSDCTSKGTGWTCRLSDNTCVAPQPITCSTNTDCPNNECCTVDLGLGNKAAKPTDPDYQTCVPLSNLRQPYLCTK